jgi:N-acetylmuramoyl-L-alanine amidase
MVKKIWWDPGHGGADPGAGGFGLREADVTLKITMYAMTYLESYYYGFEQRTTRSTDTTVELSKRDDGPDAWGADAFVSVHINAGGGTGFESHIYTSPTAASVSIQNAVHEEVLAAMRRFGAITDRGKKRSNFFVVRENNAPAVLTENLFIDTAADADKLKNEAFLKAVGEGHARGVAKFLGLPAKEAAPYKVIIPNTAFWQARNLVIEFEQMGYKAYGVALKTYGPNDKPAEGDPYQFVIETNYENARDLVIELKTRGYDRTYGEAMR